MQITQDLKFDWFINPQARVDNDDPAGAYGDTSPNTVDTLGFNEMVVFVKLGETDIAMSELALYSSDVSAASGADDSDFSLETGFDFATGNGGPGLPSATDDDGTFALYVDLRGKKRYWALQALCGNGTAGTFIVAGALLAKGEESLSTAADRGLVSQIIG